MTHRRRNDVDPVTIMINRWERDLILDYGYPFENIERQFRESGDADLTRVNGGRVPTLGRGIVRGRLRLGRPGVVFSGGC